MEWVQGDHLTFARNPNYWQTGRPYVDSFVASPRDDQAMLVQFEAGALDIAKGPPPQRLRALQRRPDVPDDHPPGQRQLLPVRLNLGIPPLDNKQVRQALNYALDRKRFADTFLFGTGAAESLPWPTSSPAFEATKQNFYTFDLDKAAALLKQAGVCESRAGLQRAQHLAAAGQLRAGLSGRPGQDRRQAQRPRAGAGDLGRRGGQPQVQGPVPGELDLRPAGAELDAQQRARHRPELQQLAVHRRRSIHSSSPRPRPNRTPAKRKALYSQLNDILLDESFIMVLAGAPPTLVARPKVHGIEPSAHDGFYYHNTWLTP